MRSWNSHFARYSHPDGPTFADLVAWIFERVCRRDLSQPGFVLIQLPVFDTTFELRQLMLDLKHGLSRRHEDLCGGKLVYQSMGRFDQQETTKPHRDGGPEESLLLLGYEPSHRIGEGLAEAMDWYVRDLTGARHESDLPLPTAKARIGAGEVIQPRPQRLKHPD